MSYRIQEIIIMNATVVPLPLPTGAAGSLKAVWFYDVKLAFMKMATASKGE